ncbi:hypothetical protein ACFYM7_20695 [Streptomyces cyaneofuscatus]|uniref:DinB/UmuC family translesion DNA polymerase n=1 Tax=Streptomyces cyaneofuscatus TaxID=66883 RepID=UPI0036928B72
MPRTVADLAADHTRVHSVGILAALPESTVQRILGGRTGRLIHERARGIDRRAVVPSDLPYSASAQRRFPIDTLDPATVRAALLSLAVELGDRLRNRHQTARTVTLAGRGQVIRSRRLDGGPSAHTDDLRQVLYDLYADCGFQRARIRAVTARCEQLQDAARTPEQLSLDHRGERPGRSDADLHVQAVAGERPGVRIIRGQAGRVPVEVPQAARHVRDQH